MEALKSNIQENKRETFKVEGMSCSSCANTVERVLSRLDGVKAADVNFSASTATVEYDPAQLTPEKMQEAVGKTGYKLEAQANSESASASKGCC